MRRGTGGLAPWLLAGTIAWVGIVWIGWQLWQSTPPKAGFDLALLLEAARRVTAGQSPYDPAMLAGTSPSATSLFYSYPPPVAQAMTLLSWLPDGVVLMLWAIGATAGLGFVASVLARQFGRDPRRVAIAAMALAPLVLPFAVALLFGNLDAWYPLAFGLLVVATRPGASRRQQVIGGVAIGVVSVAKLHPATLLVWLAVRVAIDRRGSAARTLAAAIVAGFAILIVSLAVDGVGPWLDYVTVLRAGAGAAVVDARNMGPVSLLGQAVTLDAAALRMAQVVVALLALAITLLAAMRVRDPLASLALAIAASLVVLPVTWYHYPVALIPVGIVAMLQRPSARAWVACAIVLADLAIAFPALLWLGVGALVATMLRCDHLRDERAVPVPGDR